MAGSRCIKYRYRHIVLYEVEDLSYEIAGIERYRFAGFEVDLQPVLFLHTSDTAFKARYVIIRTGYVMTASEVHPLHISKNITKLLLDCRKSFFEVVGILFAERMEVQSGNAAEIISAEVFLRDAEPRLR